MTNPLPHRLSRRERQIMETIYRLGQASAQQVLDDLPDPPGLSSVRKMILILEKRGYLSHLEEGLHHVYLPTQNRQSAARSAMKQVLATFFGGDLETAVTTLLSEAETQLSDAEAARLSALIDAARGEEPREGRSDEFAHSVNDDVTEGGEAK